MGCQPDPRIKIRPATHGDVSALVPIYHRAYDQLDDLGFPSSMTSATEDRFEDWLDTREMFVAIIPTPDGDGPDDTGEIVGCVHLTHHDDWPCPELGRLAVDPNHQDDGIGSLLREHVEDFARECGHDRIRLRTFTGHPFLREWYEAAGYEHVSDQALDTPQYDLHVMEKSLRATS